MQAHLWISKMHISAHPHETAYMRNHHDQLYCKPCQKTSFYSEMDPNKYAIKSYPHSCIAHCAFKMAMQSFYRQL